jgi:hypothetical protein
MDHGALKARPTCFGGLSSTGHSLPFGFVIGVTVRRGYPLVAYVTDGIESAMAQAKTGKRRLT